MLTRAARAVWWVIGAVALTCSCSTVRTVADQLEVRDGQAQAVHIIWVETYGRNDRPPLIRWVSGESLNCTVAENGRPGFRTPLLGCRQGRTLSRFAVAVAFIGDEVTYADTILAHELMHAAHLRDGILDPEHTRFEWGAGGLVERANAKVMEAGR